MKLNIYTLREAKILGGQTEETQIETTPLCDNCTLREERFTKIVHEFSDYDGEDFFQGLGNNMFIISSRLIKREIKGFELLPIIKKHKKNKYAIFDKKKFKSTEFFHLNIIGKAKSKAEMWKYTDCDQNCGKQKWTYTEKWLVEGDNEYERQVFEDSWNGDDIFFLDEPGNPVITENLLQILEEFEVKDLDLIPAHWVD